MKKHLLLTLVVLLCLPLLAMEANKCIADGQAVGTSATIQDGVDYAALPVFIGKYDGEPSPEIAIQVTFTRSGESSSMVDFNFLGSLDGTTYSSVPFVTISLATNSVAAGNIVTKIVLVNAHKIGYLKLGSITNNDSSNALTAANATISH